MDKFNSRSILARMMAEENLFVEHDPKANTASFALNSRILVLPVWKDMPDAVYIKFVGHEIGHALETPPEKWSSAMRSDFAKELHLSSDYWHDLLNVIEDIRIEAIVKSRFPGIRKFFIAGYRALLKKDFFGPLEDFASYDFASRINIHYKMSIDSTIEFTEIEQRYIDILDSLTDFDSVVVAAEKIAKYTLALGGRRIPSGLLSDFDRKMIDDLGDVGGDPDGGLGGGSGPANYTVFGEQGVTSLRAENLVKRDFVDTNAAPHNYVTVPVVDTTKWVTRWRDFYETKVFSEVDHQDGRRKTLKKFLDTNNNYINNLIREFQIHRSATRFRKSQVSKSGELDVDKLAHYKTKKDLFVRNVIVPDDKNHGMMMMVDMSSSMQSKIKETIKQTVILAEFCRRMKIPFAVYTFTTSEGGGYYNQGGRASIPANPSLGKGYLVSDDSLQMIEILSSEMTKIQFNMAAGFLIKSLIKHIPMGGTPLDEAIVYLTELGIQFRKKTQVEKMITIIMTDGDGTGSVGWNNSDGHRQYIRGETSIRHQNHKDTVTMNCSKLPLTTGLLEVYSRTVRSAVVSYYVCDVNQHNREVQCRMFRDGVNDPNYVVNYDKQMVSAGYYHYSPSQGYDKVFIIPSNNIKMTELSFDDDRKYTLEEIEDEFLGQTERLVKTRMFVNEFIKQIA